MPEKRVVSASDVLAKIDSAQPADFDNCIIVGDLNLSRMKIDEEVHFNNTLFQNSVNFKATTFGNAAYFGGSKFNGDTNFGFSKFKKGADFGFSKFNKGADFGYSKFNDTAYFSHSSFNEDADFKMIDFQKETRFSDSKFSGDTSFYGTQFKEDALFEGADFNGTLDLTRTKYDNLFISWRNIKNLAYDDAAYLSLLENFKKLGYLEDYDNCYFEYRTVHRSQSWSGGYHGIWPPEEWIRKKIDVLLEWSYGYGTKPLNALYFSIAIIIVFSIFWRAIGLSGPDDMTGENDNGLEKPDGIFDILGFSATIFLSGTKLFIDPPAIPKIKGRSRSFMKKAFTFERILGALFSILFFLAIGGTVIR